MRVCVCVCARARMRLRNETWDFYWLSDPPHRHRKWFCPLGCPTAQNQHRFAYKPSNDLMQWFSMCLGDRREHADSWSVHKKRVGGLTEEKKVIRPFQFGGGGGTKLFHNPPRISTTGIIAPISSSWMVRAVIKVLTKQTLLCPNYSAHNINYRISVIRGISTDPLQALCKWKAKAGQNQR